MAFSDTYAEQLANEQLAQVPWAPVSRRCRLTMDGVPGTAARARRHASSA